MERWSAEARGHGSATSSAVVSMVAPLWCGQRARESMGEHEREQRVSEGRLGQVGLHSMKSRAHVQPWWGIPYYMVTTRHNLEHMVRVTMPDLEAIFGPALLRTGLWVFKQSYFSPDALQLVLRVFSH